MPPLDDADKEHDTVKVGIASSLHHYSVRGHGLSYVRSLYRGVTGNQILNYHSLVPGILGGVALAMY